MGLQGTRVLVTGADGFIGSHLTEELVKTGATVRAFCLYNSNSSWGWLDEAEPEIKKGLDVRLGDIRDARFVEEACKGVEVVFHLAALIAIPYSYQAPESFVDTNVKGTLNVLEAVRRSGCRRMVQTSTSEVYGTPDTVPITESHSLKGQSPYSASKIAADKLCEAYWSSFDVPVVTLRPFNTYGPRQSLRAVIPTMLAQLLSGTTEIKLGNLAPKRDLTFVADTVQGFVKAAEAKQVEGEVIQLGTGRTVSIGELFGMVCSVLDIQATIAQETQRLRPGRSEVEILQSAPVRARELLRWSPEVSLEEGIARTARWLRPRVKDMDVSTYRC